MRRIAGERGARTRLHKGTTRGELTRAVTVLCAARIPITERIDSDLPVSPQRLGF